MLCNLVQICICIGLFSIIKDGSITLYGNIKQVVARRVRNVNMLVKMTKQISYTLPSHNSGIKRGQCLTRIKSPSCKVSTRINLIKPFLGAGYLVLSGDVSLNPGPITDPCVVCKKGCRRNQRMVQCDKCDLWCHAKRDREREREMSTSVTLLRRCCMSATKR